LDDVLGKLLERACPFAAPASAAACAGDALRVALLRKGCVELHLTDCEMDGRGAEDRAAATATAERWGALGHGLHTNSRRERRGAALRSRGMVVSIEAMGEVRSEVR
jgi:hypothetical protein